MPTGAVLIIEDEGVLAKNIQRYLQREGFEVRAAGTGREGLRQYEEFGPDVVLLDLGLPGIDGLEVIRGLRGWTSVPIVVLSVREAEADKVAALDLGADDYLTKPFGMNELLARLRAALRRHQPAAEEPDGASTTTTASTSAATSASSPAIALTATPLPVMGDRPATPGRTAAARHWAGRRCRCRWR